MREDLGRAAELEEELEEEDDDRLIGVDRRRFLVVGSFTREMHDDSPGQHSQRTSINTLTKDVYTRFRKLLYINATCKCI